MLHTFRNVIDNDEKWFGFLKAYYDRFKFTTTNTSDFMAFVNEYFKKDYSKIFEQYLFYPGLPRLGYKLKQEGNDLSVKYTRFANIDSFDMPIKIGKEGQYEMIYPVAGEMKETILKNMNKNEFKIASELFLSLIHISEPTRPY